MALDPRNRKSKIRACLSGGHDTGCRQRGEGYGHWKWQFIVSDALLHTDEMCVTFGGLRAVDSLDLQVEPAIVTLKPAPSASDSIQLNISDH